MVGAKAGDRGEKKSLQVPKPVRLARAKENEVQVASWKSPMRPRLSLLLALLLSWVTSGVAGVAQHEYWLPVAVNSSGLNDTLWRTEVALINLSCSQEAEVQMFLYAAGGVQLRERTLAPSRQLVLPDVVAEVFGLSSTSGPLRILSSQPLTVAGRVFNQTASGTLGQTMDGVRLEEAFARGERLFLLALREDIGFRSNLQILNMGGGRATVRLRMVVGTKETTKEVAVPPRSLTHLQQPLREVAVAATNAWAEVTILEGERVWPFASVVDNRTGDATTIRPVAGTSLTSNGWLGVVARTPGLSGTSWRTSLSLLNPGTSELSARVRFLTPAAAPQERQVNLKAGEQTTWEDLLMDLFNFSQATGSLSIETDGEIAAMARIFNQSPEGTFGQSVPLIVPGSTLRVGASAVLPFLRQGKGTFRSNVDLVNTGGTTANVRMAVFAEGAAAAAVVTSVPAGDRVRIDEVFAKKAGLAEVENGFAVFTVEQGDGLWFLGSVVDQKTGDPTTVTATVLNITSPPTPAFSWEPSSVAAAVPVTFRDGSSCFPHDWRWEFESLPPSSGQPLVQQTFPSAGEFTVRLTSRNAAGWSAELAKTVKIESPVEARFVATPSPTAVGVPVVFEDRSSGPVSEWEWSFGDGATSSKQSPTHAFAAPGEYPVTLRVRGAGTEDTYEERLKVRALVAGMEYQPRSPKVGEEIRLFDTSLGSPTRWRWAFGDGQESSEQHPRHSFSGGGPYTVSLTVGNDLGEDSVVREIMFLPDPSITFEPPLPEANRPAFFTGNSTAPVTWWRWNLGDGSALDESRTREHAFAAEGRYTVNLTAGNQAGTAWTAVSMSVRGPCAVPPAPEIVPLHSASSSCPYYVRWSPTSPHQSYELQESSDSGFTANLRTFSVEGVNESPRLGPSGGSSDRIVYYRVRARAGDYCDQRWSSWSPAVAVKVGPAEPCQVRVVSLPKGRELELVRIPAGVFAMGSPADEPWRLEDETLHQVTISRDYYIGRHEITQGLWKDVMGSNPSRFPNCGDDCAQDSISWYAACGLRSEYCGQYDGFIRRLNDLAAPQLQGERLIFRLPTEAEWEYAARSTRTGPYVYPVTARPDSTFPLLCDGACGGCPQLDRQAWWCANSLDGVREVGQKLVNPWGLYDVVGGLAEWVEDWYGAYPSEPVVDPRGPARGSYRVLRGGTWYYYARFTRLALRLGDLPGYGDFGFGLRVALAPSLASPTNASATDDGIEVAPPRSSSLRKGPSLPDETERRRAAGVDPGRF